MATSRRSSRATGQSISRNNRHVGGVVKNGKREGVPGCIVKALRVDLKQQALVGSALTDRTGRYEIAYDVSPLQLPPAAPLHLQVEALSPLGASLATSEVRFDATAREVINLQVEASAQLSEYEQISGPVRLAAGELADTGVSPDDVPFLLNRIKKRSAARAAQTVVTRERVELWVDSETLASGTRLPASFFYGVARVKELKAPRSIATYVALSDQDASAALREAVRKRVIPALSFESLQAAWSGAKLGNRTVSEQRLTGRVVDDATSTPLEKLRVRITQVASRTLLGTTLTDADGAFVVIYLAPPGSAERFSIEITDLLGSALHTVTVEAQPHVVTIRVALPAEADASPNLIELSQTLGFTLPREIPAFLRAKGLETLGDLRAAGGFRSMPDLPVPAQEPALRRLDDHASLLVLGNYQAALIDRIVQVGFASPARIANTKRSTFVRAVKPILSSHPALTLQARAQASEALLQNMRAGLRADRFASKAAGGASDEVSELRSELAAVQSDSACRCSDCDAVASPAAYLADLLDYCKTYAVNGAVVLDAPALEALLFQPFMTLRASCTDVQEAVAQVRVCIEVLHRYLASRSLPAAGSDAETALNRAYTAYLERAQEALLRRLGTSQQEVRSAVIGNEPLPGLGIPDDAPLNELVIDIGNPTLAHSERELERVFGLADTRRDVFSQGATLDDTQGQIVRWSLEGVSWRRNTDEAGTVHVALTERSPGVHRVEAFRDAARTELMAAGDADADGVVILVPAPVQDDQASSGLRGFIQLQFQAPATGIRLCAIPLLLTLKLRRLYGTWALLDGTEPQPKLDPDVISIAELHGPVEENGAFFIWKTRHEQIQSRRDVLRELHSGLADAARFDALLGETGLDVNSSELTAVEKSRLQELQRALTATPPLPALETDWDAMADILVQVEKRRLYPTWLAEEAVAGIHITPDLFQPPADLVGRPRELPAFRADASQYRRFLQTLRSRIEERDQMLATHATLLREVEGDTLAILRDALIEATDAVAAGSTTKADAIGARLVINARMDASVTTSRMGQAIETIQTFLWSVRTGLLNEIHPGMDLVSPNFDEEWKWLGSYASWRAAMMVFLYPENVLDPTLRRAQTPGFAASVQALRDKTRLTPLDVCKEAQRFAEYINDVGALRIEATCHARAPLPGKGCPDHSNVGTALFTFLFARSTRTGNVYMSYYRPGVATGYNQSPWQPVPDLTGVSALVGASVYEMSAALRFIYIFVKKSGDRADQLLYLRWNLETHGLEAGGPHVLDMAEGAADRFAVVLQQSNDPSQPPAMVLAYNDNVFINALTRDGNALDPVVQQTLGGFFFHSGNWKPLRVVAMVALNPFPGRNYVLPQHFILIGESGTQIFYHLLYPAVEYNLDTTYGTTPISLLANGTWKGSIHLPAAPTNLVYTFCQQGGVLKHNVIFSPGKLPQSFPMDPNQSLGDLPGLAALDRVAMDSSAHLAASHNREMAYQLGGYSPGPFLGFFSRKPDGDVGSVFGDITGGVLETLSVGRVRAMAFRINTGIGTTGLGDGGVFDPGGGFPPPPPPPLPEPPDFLPLFDLNRIRLAPLLRQPVASAQRLTESQLQLRRAVIAGAFADNAAGPRSNLEYLEEAYYFFPVLVALQLQRRGHYQDALDWLRTVYDFTQPLALRKIYAGLIEEESLPWSYDRNITWLLEPLNPHAIAATRRNTYTRYTLQALAQCLLEFGDSEFSRDTGESIARAYVLYSMALALLQSDDLNPEPPPCDEVIKALGNETSGDFASSPPAIDDVYTGLIAGLRGVHASLSDLTATAADVRLALQSDASLLSRLARASRIVHGAKYARADLSTVGSVLRETEENSARVNAILLRRSRVVHALEEVSVVAAADAEHTMTSLTGQPKEIIRKLDLPWLETNVKTVDIESALVSGAGAAHLTLLNRVGASNPLTVVAANQQMKPVFFIAPREAFCVPPNPAVKALRTQVELCLAKIRVGRNIGGLERTLPLVGAGTPALDARGDVINPDALISPPALFRYRTLIERAKQLVTLAQQLEATFLSILEKRDAEFYNLLKARQDLNLSLAGVRLQQLGMVEARDNVHLAQLQFERAQLQSTYYGGLLEDADGSLLERYGLVAMGIAGVVAGIITENPVPLIHGLSTLKGVLTGSTNDARIKELKQALALARQDEEIGTQGIRLAYDRLQIRSQELNIISMQSSHAQQTLDFLVNKFTNAELYDWMSVVIEGVYRNFLQQATAAAQIAANQLAFERQEPIPRFIQSDYWEALVGLRAELSGEDAPDRRGLTGSARLLQDVFQLDQYGFDTEQRKQQLTKTISLARLAPGEFQRFRETGELHFVTLLSMFDADFPGHFLRLIKRAQVTVLALVPPTEGIKATLSTGGISRVVAHRDGGLVETLVRRQPENVSLSTPLNASGDFDLSLRQDNDSLRPFEGSGVATDWTFTLPKPANHFDYGTIADVLLTLDYTALFSSDYRNEVVARLGTEVSSQRAFTFRYELGDVWFDLNNPDQTATPMTVRFESRREDFEANASGLLIRDVAMFFSLAEGETFEIVVNELSFTPVGATSSVGGSATSSDGVISLRRGNAANWVPMVGLAPIGTWQLSLPDTPEVRARFTEGRIADVVFAISVAGTASAWPG
jgi:hypothetical protein